MPDSKRVQMFVNDEDHIAELWHDLYGHDCDTRQLREMVWQYNCSVAAKLEAVERCEGDLRRFATLMTLGAFDEMGARS